MVTGSSKSEREKLEKKLLHYTGKAIADFKMIESGDKILVCLSGGKDSFTMLAMLKSLQLRSKKKFELFVFSLKQENSEWYDGAFKTFLVKESIPHEILTKDIYSVVKAKVKAGSGHCSLCSRLRRGIIYSYAKEYGYNKIALGHHRDDLIQTLLMSIFYSGAVRSMPPKLLTNDKKHIVIRPLAYCQEKDIARYAKLKDYPIINCNMYCKERGTRRESTAKLIETLTKENPKIPSNILHAIGSIHPSQMMDHNLWNFKDLEILL